ncbi:MAG: hypothetical protein DMF82_24935 [Acidobacteria bacterium]|nr:MAG: hypothetical protein DMF82_24935 [Acidobacteriota bacterium]
MIADAVNCLVNEASSKTVSDVTGASCSRLASHARDLLPRHLRAHELVPPGERVRVRGGGDEHEQDRRRALDQEREGHECDSTTAGGPRLWLLAG